jgi:hypothetical protein
VEQWRETDEAVAGGEFGRAAMTEEDRSIGSGKKENETEEWHAVAWLEDESGMGLAMVGGRPGVRDAVW